MKEMAKGAQNTCHAWSSTKGPIQQHIRQGEYGPVLKEIGNRVFSRWGKKKLED